MNIYNGVIGITTVVFTFSHGRTPDHDFEIYFAFIGSGQFKCQRQILMYVSLFA